MWFMMSFCVEAPVWELVDNYLEHWLDVFRCLINEVLSK